MQLITHKGTHMIGETCIELQADGCGLLLDIGLPLVNPDGSGFDDASAKKPVSSLIKTGVLPDIPGLYDDMNCKIAGIVLTHAHRDHFGLGPFVHSDIPIFSSEITKKLIGPPVCFFRTSLILYASHQ